MDYIEHYFKTYPALKNEGEVEYSLEVISRDCHIFEPVIYFPMKYKGVKINLSGQLWIA